MQREGFQCPFPIRDLGCRYTNRVRQSLVINGDMALDSRYLFTRIVSFVLGGIGIFDALRINDQKGGLCVPTMFDAGRANLIFLKPAPTGLLRFPLVFLSIA